MKQQLDYYYHGKHRGQPLVPVFGGNVEGTRAVCDKSNDGPCPRCTPDFYVKWAKHRA